MAIKLSLSDGYHTAECNFSDDEFSVMSEEEFTEKAAILFRSMIGPVRDSLGCKATTAYTARLRYESGYNAALALITTPTAFITCVEDGRVFEVLPANAARHVAFRFHRFSTPDEITQYRADFEARTMAGLAALRERAGAASSSAVDSQS